MAAHHDWKSLPLISARQGGLELRGEPGPLAETLYAQGTPPAHGLAAKTVDVDRVASIRFGDVLSVERRGSRWVALDASGAAVGALRWRAGDIGKAHAQTGATIAYPDRGTLEVLRAVVTPDGVPTDIAGTVRPDN